MAEVPLSSSEFEAIAAVYREQYGLPLVAIDRRGRVLFGDATLLADLPAGPTADYLLGECLRWGEPTIGAFPGEGDDHRLLWAVPIMHNADCRGGLITGMTEDQLFPHGDGVASLDSRGACRHLRALAEQYNITNGHLLAEARRVYRREQAKAYYLHDSKTSNYAVQEAYLREEPYLLSAIRHGDRREATKILNRILGIIYQRGGDQLDLIKSFLMELVATMCRAAVEAGGDARQLLGGNYTALNALAAAEDDEELSGWLVGMLNRIFDVIETSDRRPTDATLQAALTYIEQHFDEPLTRDGVAEAIGVSPSHFSTLLSERTGRGFTDTLNHIRIDRAADLLRRTDKSLLQVAIDVGFSDQSHFTKVFKRHLGLTPSAYRKRL